jgi:RsiW-degrading membrane proteinase PrsW (M82 family)
MYYIPPILGQSSNSSDQSNSSLDIKVRSIIGSLFPQHLSLRSSQQAMSRHPATKSNELSPLHDMQSDDADARGEGTAAGRKSLSRETRRALFLGMSVAVAAIAIESPTTAMLLPVLAFPTLWVWKRNGASTRLEQTDPTTVVCTYLFTGTVGMVLAMVAQATLAYVFALVIFRADADKYLTEFLTSHREVDDIQHHETRRAMTRQWPYWMFLPVFCFLAAGLVEEGLKYCVLLGARRFGKIHTKHNYVVVAGAAALGFATVENLAFVYASTQSDESLASLTLTVLERLAVGISGHMMTAALVAVDVVARDLKKEPKTWWQILWLPVLFHGGLDFALLALSAYEGNIGWVHPKGPSTVSLALAVVVGFQSTLAVVVKRRLGQDGISF